MEAVQVKAAENEAVPEITENTVSEERLMYLSCCQSMVPVGINSAAFAGI